MAKYLIGAGIQILGDRPLGWRIMSALFGSLTLVAMYHWARVIFQNERSAWLVVLLTISNHLFYVQSRIAMLEPFMVAFIVWALVFFSSCWKQELSPSSIRLRLWLTGAMLGLSISCKWFGLIPWALCLGMAICFYLFRSWKVTFKESRETDWYQESYFQGIKLRDWWVAFLVLPVTLYVLTYLPLVLGPNFSVSDFLALHKKMWEGQKHVAGFHRYTSHWTDWVWLKRPVWYAFHKEGSPSEWVRGVILLGNPVLMWGGLVAVAFSLWAWVRWRLRAAFLIALPYLAFVLCWTLIPRKISFYYYYYPAGLVLGLAIVFVFDYFRRSPFEAWVKRLETALVILSFAVFIYFFPILAAFKIPLETFRRWMWLQSWI